MKILSAVILALFFISCSRDIGKASITDCGKKEIGKGLYLKKIMVNKDRIYLLVDENNKLISGNTATSYTVYEHKTANTEKGSPTTTSHIESNSLIN
jgi:hypothetical protein